MNLDFKQAAAVVDKLNHNMDYVCFGAGRYFYDFVHLYCEEKKMIKKPKYVCDNNSSLWGGKLVCGVEVVPPDRLLDEKPDKIIIIMSAVAPFGIMADLQSLKWQRHYYYILPLSQLEAYFYVTQNYHRIEQVYERLADRKSQQDYEKFWQLTLDGIMNYASIYTANAYWNNDLIPQLSDGDGVLYAGAFDGKHIDRALSNNSAIRFYGFEPNSKMLSQLKEKYRDQTNVFLYPYALDDHKDTFDFDTSVPLGAMIVREDKSGGMRVASELEKVVSSTIDMEITDKLNLIALDIEGAEPEALQGAVQTIRRWQPKLAICVYHRIHHYVDIPQLICTIYPKYKLYFRHHSVAATESVVYAMQ